MVGSSRDFSPAGSRSQASDFKAASLVVKSGHKSVPQLSELVSPAWLCQSWVSVGVHGSLCGSPWDPQGRFYSACSPSHPAAHVTLSPGAQQGLWAKGPEKGQGCRDEGRNPFLCQVQPPAVDGPPDSSA